GRPTNATQPHRSSLHGAECTAPSLTHRRPYGARLQCDMDTVAAHTAAWFDLTTDQRAILGPLRDFLTAEVAPGAAKRDAEGDFPHQLVAALGAMGLFGMQVPERYGGSGLDSATAALVI